MNMVTRDLAMSTWSYEKHEEMYNNMKVTEFLIQINDDSSLKFENNLNVDKAIETCQKKGIVFITELENVSVNNLAKELKFDVELRTAVKSKFSTLKKAM